MQPIGRRIRSEKYRLSRFAFSLLCKESRIKKTIPNKMSHRNNECRIYVGNLPPDIRTKDIQDLFHKFGKVTFVDLKNRRGPPFAFVEFEDSRYVNLDTNNRPNNHFFSAIVIDRFVSFALTRVPLSPLRLCRIGWLKALLLEFDVVFFFSSHHFNGDSKIVMIQFTVHFLNYFSLSVSN